MGKKEKTAIKVVLDTNTLVSALLFKGNVSKIVDLWKKRTIAPIFSQETFREFKSVLEYPKFSLSGLEIKAIIEEELLPYFEVVNVEGKFKGACRDSDDDKFISCALAASADIIVSGDKDLLDLGNYKSFRIISASEFLKGFLRP